MPRVLRGRHNVRHLYAHAALERRDDGLELRRRLRAVADVEHRALHQLAQDLFLAGVAERLQLDLPRGGRHQGTEVADARRGVDLAQADRALERARGEIFVVADADPYRHAGTLTDLRGLAGQVRELGDDLFHVLGRRPAHTIGGERRAFRLHDGDLVGEPPRIVRADLRPEAVLERRDDAPAVGVVLGIRAGDDIHIDRQPHLVAADLHIALLHDVEEPDLDALG